MKGIAHAPKILKIILIVCTSTIPHIFTLDGDFVFDDVEAIERNADVSHSSIRDIFQNDFWGSRVARNISHKSYRPLTVLTFRLNYLLSGGQLNPAHFKIMNLLLHILCCILTYTFYGALLKSAKRKKGVDVALVSVLLFAVHPVHVEVVSGIVGRADSLAAIAFLLSFIVYQKGCENSFVCLVWSMILSGLAMLFKENGITVLGFCLLYEVAMDNRLMNYLYPKFALPEKQHIINYSHKISPKRISLVLFTLIILLSLRWQIMGGVGPVFKPIDNPAAFSDDLITRIASYNYTYFLNFLLLMWPQWLCFDWSMGCVPLLRMVLDFRILFVVIFYLYGFINIMWIFYSKTRIETKRVTIFALAIMVVSFLPASNLLFPVGFVIAERVLYIPSIGYCLLVALGIDRIIRKYFFLKQIILVLFYSLLVLYGVRSWQRSRDWQSEYRLFTSALSVCPLNAKVHYNVAKVADAAYNTQWALEEYKEAIKLYPEFSQAMNNIGNLYKSEQKFKEAEYYLRMAIKHKQDFPAAWMNLGIVLASTGRPAESQQAYSTAIRYRRKYPDCYYNLGNLFLETKNHKAAFEAWQKAIRLKPDHVLAWANLLTLLDNSGEIERALQLIPEALEKVPEAASVNFAVANIYGKAENYEESEKYFKKALSLFGSRAKAIHYGNLGVLYHRWKKYDLAKLAYKRALAIDPAFKTALTALQKIKHL